MKMLIFFSAAAWHHQGDSLVEKINPLHILTIYDINLIDRTQVSYERTTK